jgi:hypothetical protein
MKEPIIKRENFLNAIKKEIKLTSKDRKDNILDLKLLDYPIIKQIMDNCNALPDKHRFIIWKYLLSLPCDKENFEFFNNKGIHQFFNGFENRFPLKDQNTLRKLKQICSLISHWSPHIGNVYFLPNLVFPFVKSIKGDDLLIFELLIAFITTYGQYWFEYYPGAPVHHFKLIEKILSHESKALDSFFKSREENRLLNIYFNELVWRLLKNIFSESLPKESWLQLMDFLFTYNHKPELILYFIASFILNHERQILKTKSQEELEGLLFNINKTVSITKLVNTTHKLFEKYSKYQLIGYKPYIPFPEKDYPSIFKFPVDFLEATSQLKEDLFRQEMEFKENTKEVDLIENKIQELLKKEELMQKTYESIIYKEREKAKVYKQELDMLVFQKEKYYDLMKNKKLEKVEQLQNIINNSLKFHSEMNKAELSSFEGEMKRKRNLEEYDFKKKIQQEELNGLDIETTKKMIDLINLRNKEEKSGDGLVKEYKNKILEEELEFKKYMNTREIESIKKNEKNSDFSTQRNFFSDREFKFGKEEFMNSYRRNELIGSLRENLKSIEEEENLLKEKEFELKSSKGSQGQIDEFKRIYEIKKAELALKKNQITQNLDRLIEYSIDTNNSNNLDMFVSQNSKLDKQDLRGSGLSIMSGEELKARNFYDIKQVNNEIRNNITSKGFSKYPDYNELKCSLDDLNDSVPENNIDYNVSLTDTLITSRGENKKSVMKSNNRFSDTCDFKGMSGSNAFKQNYLYEYKDSKPLAFNSYDSKCKDEHKMSFNQINTVKSGQFSHYDHSFRPNENYLQNSETCSCCQEIETKYNEYRSQINNTSL